LQSFQGMADSHAPKWLAVEGKFSKNKYKKVPIECLKDDTRDQNGRLVTQNITNVEEKLQKIIRLIYSMGILCCIFIAFTILIRFESFQPNTFDDTEELGIASDSELSLAPQSDFKINVTTSLARLQDMIYNIAQNLNSHPNFSSQSHDRMEKVEESFPHKTIEKSSRDCGIIWFYHVHKTGGSTITSHMEYGWKRRKWPANFQFHDTINFLRKHQPENIWKVKLKSIQTRATKLLAQDGNYIFVHHHHSVPNFCEVQEEPAYQKIKDIIQQKGCRIWSFVTLRDPHDHFYSVMGQWHVKQKDWPFYFSDKFRGFLFHIPSIKGDVLDAMRCLEFFDDVFFLEQLDHVVDEIDRLMRWPPFKARKRNVRNTQAKANIPAAVDQALREFLEDSGEAEFYRRAKEKYYKDPL